MSSESTLPPPLDEQDQGESSSHPEQTPSSDKEVPAPSADESKRAQRGVQFSFFRWATTGPVRLLYRIWTRIAVRFFPEGSRNERIARSLHIPLPDTLNMSWVNDRLAVGGRIRPQDIPALARVGITSVIDTRSEYQDDAEALGQENIELLYLPTPDTYPLTIEQLKQGAEWANERLRHGGRVLIHCEHGVGRSVLLTCATLVDGGMTGSEALELVKRKRWQAAPNARQVARLREFERAYPSHKA